MNNKDIKRKLNNDIDNMAPDILQNILSQPIEKIETEEELFGKNETLFEKEKSSIYRGMTFKMAMAVSMCLVLLITLVYPGMIGNETQTVYAFSVNIDVNPSVRINVNTVGRVESVKALNKDAKKLLEKVPNLKKENYLKATKIIMDSCYKKGYLKKKKSAALVSIVSKDKTVNKNNFKNLKKVIKNSNKSKGVIIFQNYKTNKKATKLAKKYKVSAGKANLCIKVAKNKKEAGKLCKKDLSYILKKAKKEKVIKDKDLDKIVDYDNPDNMGLENNELETVAETVSEEYIDETESATEFEEFTVQENNDDELVTEEAANAQAEEPTVEP